MGLLSLRREKERKECQMTDPYYELQHADREDLLEVLICYYKNWYPEDDYRDMVDKYLRMGFQLAQEDGWMLVAPAWLRDYFERIGIK